MKAVLAVFITLGLGLTSPQPLNAVVTEVTPSPTDALLDVRARGASDVDSDSDSDSDSDTDSDSDRRVKRQRRSRACIDRDRDGWCDGRQRRREPCVDRNRDGRCDRRGVESRAGTIADIMAVIIRGRRVAP